MPGYIHAWRREHAQILEALLQVPQLGFFTRAGQMKFEELKRMLEAHLKHEELDFYPVLKKGAETDPELRRQLFLFAADMDKIAAEVRAFFLKRESEPAGKDLAGEFRKIAGMIQSRISREENLLMKEFGKLTEAKASPTKDSAAHPLLQSRRERNQSRRG